MNIRTKKLTAAAMLCALSYVAVVVGRVPVVLFLKYDPKDVIIALGGLIWGPAMAFVVAVVVSIIEMVTVGVTGALGCVMNILSSCAFACTAAALAFGRRSRGGILLGLMAGGLVMTLTMLLWNALIAPLYMGVSRETIIGMLIPVFLPFNLLKAGLNTAFTALLFRPVTAALRQAGMIEKER